MIGAVLLLGAAGSFFALKHYGTFRLRWEAETLYNTTLSRFTASESESYWRADWQRMAGLGDGFIVWESNRAGAWHIWRRDLDGSGLRPISSEEPGPDHYCPHISPDGAHIACLSFPAP